MCLVNFFPFHIRVGLPKAVALGLMLLALRSACGGREPSFAPPPQVFNQNSAMNKGFDGAPHLAADGRGNWVAVYESFDSDDPGKPGDLDIFVSRSSDDGVSWTDPARIAKYMEGDDSFDDGPKVATDRNGNWVAVWYSQFDLGGSSGKEFKVLSSTSNDDGKTWTAPIAVNSFSKIEGGVDDWPEIATDTHGLWLTVLRSTHSLGGRLGGEGDILIVRSMDNGKTWSESTPLNDNAEADEGDDAFPQIATDEGGHWIAVWVTLDSLQRTSRNTNQRKRVVCATSSNQGISWSDPSQIGDGEDDPEQQFPQIAMDREGHCVSIWESNATKNRGKYSIVTARSDDAGENWENAQPIAEGHPPPEKGPWANAQIATDGHGLWVALWSAVKNEGGEFGKDCDLFYSCSSDRGEHWTRPGRFNSGPANHPGENDYAQLKCDGKENWIALWSSTDPLRGRSGQDNYIMSSRVSSSVVRATLDQADRDRHHGLAAALAIGCTILFTGFISWGMKKKGK